MNCKNCIPDSVVVFLKKYGLFLFWIICNASAFIVQKKFLPYLYMIIIPLKLGMEFFYFVIIVIRDIWRKINCCKKPPNIKEYANNKLAMTITCYTESVADILLTVDSLCDSINNSTTNGILFVIYDGLSIEKDTDKYTWEIIMEKMNMISYIDNIDYTENWKNIPIKINLGFCKYKNIPIVNIIKQTNLGKTDSLTFTRDLLKNYLSEKLTNIIKTGIQQCDYNLDNIYFCGSMDADCTVNKDGIQKLYDNIIQKNIAGACGVVYPKYDQIKNFWELYQHAEYFAGQLITRMGQSVYGKVTCLPGALNICDIHYYTDKVRNAFLKIPVRKNIYRSLSVLVGEDRRFTSLLLYYHKKVYNIMDDNVKVFTTVPQTFKQMKSQRRRWITAALINDFYDMNRKNLHPLLRFESFCNNSVKFFLIYIHYVIITSFFGLDTYPEYNVVLYFLILTGVTFAYKILMMYKMPGWKLKVKYLIGQVCFAVVSQFFFIYMIIYCLLKLDDFKWGNIKQNVISESNSSSNLSALGKNNNNNSNSQSLEIIVENPVQEDVQNIVGDLINKVTEPNKDLEIVEVDMDKMVEVIIN